MFTTNELQNLQDALQLAINSNKRAINTKKPQFREIHEQIDKELQTLSIKIAQTKPLTK